MKLKHIFIILIVVIILLFYNLFCYHLVNKQIEKNTKNIIESYFAVTCRNCSHDYQYLRATKNEDGTMNVYIKENQNYYRFILNQVNNQYQLIEVSQDIPAYIR